MRTWRCAAHPVTLNDPWRGYTTASCRSGRRRPEYGHLARPRYSSSFGASAMSRLVSILFFALTLIAPPEAGSDTSGVSKADAEAIRALIESQLAAFAIDDAQTAFSFAS